MNLIEKQMVEVLKTLKADFGATAVKGSMEAEGIFLSEMLRLKEIVMTADLGLSIKIGGCEALTDARLAKGFGASILMSPMIESRFALEKFLDMVSQVFCPESRKDVRFSINIETIDGYHKIDDILDAANIELLDSIVLGRTDLRGALKVPDVDCPEILNIAKTVFTKAKDKSIDCIVGGGISKATIPFLEELGDLVKGFETRKVVFGDYLKKKELLSESIQMAMRFEHLWYKFRKETYLELYREDEEKIKKIEAML